MLEFLQRCNESLEQNFRDLNQTAVLQRVVPLVARDIYGSFCHVDKPSVVHYLSAVISLFLIMPTSDKARNPLIYSVLAKGMQQTYACHALSIETAVKFCANLRVMPCHGLVDTGLFTEREQLGRLVYEFSGRKPQFI
jgi:hypothetical protein